jgi:hypothetical protein
MKKYVLAHRLLFWSDMSIENKGQKKGKMKY